MPSFFFAAADLPEIPRRDDRANDDFLFAQGPARGLGTIRFYDYRRTLAQWTLPNVALFAEQVEVFREMLATAPPDETQRKDVDFLLASGQLFALVVYAQLILASQGCASYSTFMGPSSTWRPCSFYTRLRSRCRARRCRRSPG